MVHQGYTIVRASKKLALKPYTAANILNKYKEKGGVYDYVQKKYVTNQHRPETQNSPRTQNLEEEKARPSSS